MSAISLGSREHHPSLRQAPLLRGARSLAREVVGSVPLLQRTRTAAAVSATVSTRESTPVSTRVAVAVRGSGSVAPRPAIAGRTGGRARAGLRLTRRGRLLLVGLPTLFGGLAAAALLILLLAPSQVVAGTEAVEGPGVETVAVQPGQSLWEVAQLAEPEEDTRAVVAQIVELNGFASAEVQTGQQVLIPAA